MKGHIGEVRGLMILAVFATGFAICAPVFAGGEAILEGAMAQVDEIVFAVRVSGRDHWYANFGYYCDEEAHGAGQSFGPYPDGQTVRAYDDGGRLCRLELRTGKLRVLLDDPKGGVRDPQVHYSGEKILFSYRKGGTAAYHLYEINIDGSGLRQLTDGPDDDIEPTYLPDGGIMFCSSRCHRFVNCWSCRVANLHRCDGDGGNLRMISSNNEHENTPWVLPDGRVLYMRWEYIDRSQIHFHHLWTVNPDGTRQAVYYGNQHPGTVMLDAKPIPGTNKLVASFSPGHGIPEHRGHVTIVDPSMGPDVLEAARQISRGWPVYRDPYPISEDRFLVATRRGIHVMDGDGETQVVYELPAEDRHMECHEPRPLRPRPVEPVLSPQVDLSKETGEVFLADVYTGRNMAGIRRGEIKKLLVLEVLPEPVHYSGGMEPISVGGTFTMSRVLGTVPVEEDGSAYMELPAMRSLYFVALDKNDTSVKRMKSFLTVQPGETTGCVGCHERRSLTAPTTLGMSALAKPPRRITPIEGVPEVFDYPRDVQPILNKYCVECHNSDHGEGNVDLSGDRTPCYSISYLTLFRHQMVADGRNRKWSTVAPRTIGSSASRLLEYLDGNHYNPKVTPEERKMIRLWIESSAAYPGTYAALGSGMYPPQLPVGMMLRRCGECHVVDPKNKNRAKHFISLEAACNLSRPEQSTLLRAPLAASAGGLGLCRREVFRDTSDPGYQALLRSIQDAAGELEAHKRFDMPGFRPVDSYIREMKRFGILPEGLGPDAPVDPYKTDQEYWKSFWHRPSPDHQEN